MNRRLFLKICGAMLLWQVHPRQMRSGFAEETRHKRHLVLIELKGGNDGLNMLVPFSDDRYYRLRPKLAVQRDRVLQISETQGFHPQLAPLMDIWKQRQLAIINGVGYPRPNRSHFRSIDIWETGSSSDEYLQNGWLARLLPHMFGSQTAVADGAAIGGGAGPLVGSNLNVVVMRNVRQFFKRAQKVQNIEATTDNPALQHLLSVHNNLNRTATKLKHKLDVSGNLSHPFPETEIGRNLETAARLIANGVEIPAIKVSLSGFDTHANQQNIHDRLLGQLAKAVVAFRNALQPAGRWESVVVMTYSEFGRRPAENSSRGTDHGTAAPLFMLGDNVRGGIYGDPPSLDDLESGDLKFNIDFRSIYTTIARRWWGVNTEFLSGGPYPIIDCLS